MDLFIGIEGSGMRHSVAVMADQQGSILSSVRLKEPISLHTTPVELLIDRLEKLLLNVLKRADCTLNDLCNANVCIGLTGVTFRYDREVALPQVFSRIDFPIKQLICTGDAEIAFASHAQTMTGTCILCHSGSTAYVVLESQGRPCHFRFGGWGPALGDEGSGYWMGRAALRAIGAEHEGYKHESILWEEVNAWLNNPQPHLPAWKFGSNFWKIDVRDIRTGLIKRGAKIDPRTVLFHWSHRMQQPGLVGRPADLEGFELWRKIVSGLVIPLFRAYRRGDEAARQIVEDATDLLAEQHRLACEIAKREAGATTFSPLVLYGGVFTWNPEFRQILIRKISESHHESFTFKQTDDPNVMRPACGALLFALGQSKTDHLQLPRRNTIDRVMEGQSKPEFKSDLVND
jgi:N-acetylglucosamine kinase-like BadF-type ATPase